jgi:hypothetical protein
MIYAIIEKDVNGSGDDVISYVKDNKGRDIDEMVKSIEDNVSEFKDICRNLRNNPGSLPEGYMGNLVSDEYDTDMLLRYICLALDLEAFDREIVSVIV